MRITPRGSVFYDLFTEAGANIAQAADVLVVLSNQDADRRSIAERMRELEHQGDTVSHRIFREVNTSFITPFDRDDIYRLASALDDVLDAMEEVSDFIELADVGVLPEQVGDQLRLVQRSARETATAMSRLRTLSDLEPYWIEVNRLENEADRVHRKLLSKLFSGMYEPLQLLKLREVADRLEDSSDALEHVAHAVETIAVKES
ncbi:DUF47 domain-containing protein [Jatrophihabitans sp. YIM 134969]